MKLLSLVMVAAAFLLGWLLASQTQGYPQPQELLELPRITGQTLFTLEPSPQASPSNRVNESQILVYSDRVIIKLDNPEWARFTDTHSMEPVFDKNSNAIELVPDSPEDIRIGDIISYQPADSEYPIIHRVTKLGTDKEGWYAVVKGDNNPIEDPAKVRFSEVKRVVVAIIY